MKDKNRDNWEGGADIADKSCEIPCPVLLPLYRLRRLSFAVLDMEAELPSGRDTLTMKLCNACTELCGVRQARGHVDKVTEEEVSVDG